MTSRTGLRLMWRESRGAGPRFLFFVACLSVGVAAIVSVAGLTDNLDRQIRSEARQLLAADLRIRSLQQVPGEIKEYLAGRPDLKTTRVRELVTMAVGPDPGSSRTRSQLVELKVVDGEYPFYGTIELDPATSLEALLDDRRIAVAPDLLARLGLEIGNDLRIGGQTFTLAAIVLKEADYIASPMSLGPRVFISAAGFDRTELEQFGSRIVYQTLVKLPPESTPDDLSSTAEELRDLVESAGRYRVETYIDSREQLRSSMRRSTSYLALVALLSLLLGGVGVSQTTRAWLSSRMDDIAVLRCLGLRPNEVLLLYLAQAALLGLAGSVVGVGAGLIVQMTLPSLFGDLLAGAEFRIWQPVAAIRGLALGLGVALLFGLRSLLEVRRVPPLRVLRKDVEPLGQSRLTNLLTGFALITGVWLIASVQAASLARGVAFTLGIIVAAVLLAGSAWLTIRLLAPGARKLRQIWLRHGVLALARPGAATLGAVVSLGLGVLLILGLQLVKDRLAEELSGQLPASSPTAFLVNIQPDQWPHVESLLADQGAHNIESVPIVTARLRSIDGTSVSDLAESSEDGDRRWALTREQRLTYLEALPEDNEIIAGELWSDPEIDEVSVEEEFARNLGVELGSTLRLDIQGIPFDLEVTSLRTVDWRTFGINFFLVVEPGVLDDAPQQRVATVRLPADREAVTQDDLATGFPNITLLKIRDVLERIAAVLDYLARGVRFIGAFTVFAGVIILAGGVSADSIRRRKNIALLKTLGMTQRGVAAMLAVEFAVIGLLAGLVGAIGGSLLSWAVLTRGFEMEWRLRPGTMLVAVGLTLVLTAVTGILASRRALQQRPAEVLRN